MNTSRIIPIPTEAFVAILAAGMVAGQAQAASKARVTFTKDAPNEMPEVGIVASAACEDPNGNLIEIIELAPGLRHSKIGVVYREND